MRATALALLVVGCGRVGFDPRNDGGSGDGRGGDRSSDAPTVLGQLATGQDNNDPYLSHDGLTLYLMERSCP